MGPQEGSSNLEEENRQPYNVDNLNGAAHAVTDAIMAQIQI